jgi:predicted DNA-binding protein (MmcQ/YjbR family)
MTLAALKAFSLRLPKASVVQQWGEVLVFKVAGKMFLLVPFEGDLALSASFKASADDFEALSQTDGFRPAPYLARAGWIQLEDMDAAPAARLQALVRTSYELVVAKVSAKKRSELGL